MPISGKMYVWEDRAKHVPEGPGVYAFYDTGRVIIFIGKSRNLRKEFTRHLETKFSGDPCKGEAKYYARELTSNEEDRLRELLDEYTEKHGQLPKCNVSKALPQVIKGKWQFFFYESLDKPLSESASSLDDFKEKISRVPSASLEFHQGRGDFAKWIRIVLNDVKLAEDIEKIDKVGEELRSELQKSLKSPKKMACPKCGTETSPAKTWKMAGKPSATGERLQLTISHYKCLECKKTFRKVTDREKIRAL